MGINRYVKTLILSLIILAFAFAFSNPLMATENPEDTEIPIEYIKGTVVEIIEEEHDRDLGAGNLIDYQKVKVQITSGQFKDRIVTVENYTTGNPAYDIWVKQGDKVLLVLEILAGDIFTSYIADFQRDTYIYLLTALFVLLIILIGHKQGLKAVITLGITLLLIGKFMLPLLFKGYSPVLLAIFTGVLVTAITVVAIGGFTKKSLAAVLGTSGGLVAAGIAILVGILANLSGLSNEEAQMLMFIPQETQYDFRGLLFAGIIGALGAVMDVSMSIASAMDEVQKVGSKMTFKKLFKSGMNVGKDIMGTMCNTLILAYTGTSIPLLLLFMAYQQPLSK